MAFNRMVALMAATTNLTFSQLDTLTRNLLNDNINFEATSPDSLSAQTWDEDMMAEALNFAMKEYCKATECTYVEVSATPDANGFFALPTDRLIIKRVKFSINPPAGTFTIAVTPSVRDADNSQGELNADFTMSIDREETNTLPIDITFPPVGSYTGAIYINSPTAFATRLVGNYIDDVLQSDPMVITDCPDTIDFNIYSQGLSFETVFDNLGNSVTLSGTDGIHDVTSNNFSVHQVPV